MVENRGGYRPTASQNNPTRINPMGGDGQSGKNITQPAKYISGLPYGQGQETMAQQEGAPMAAIAQPQPTRIQQMPDMPMSLEELSGDVNASITDGIDDLPPGASAGFYRTPSLPALLQKISQYDPTGDVELIYARYSDYGY
jgi:hypothetical protein